MFDQGNNLIYGPNASGKTSILEAVGYLGRGRSFRGASAREVVRHGQDNFVLFGNSRVGSRAVSLGVRNGTGGLEVHTDGEKVQRLFLPSSAVAPSEGGVSIRVLGRRPR